jgi:molecular chaperone GrpE (heat shock protein)
MGLFGFGKKKELVDWTEDYKMRQAGVNQLKKQQAQQVQKDNASQPSGNGPFSFFDSPAMTGTNTPDTSYESTNETPEEKRKRLSKRIMDMTERLEDLSNQIYHLQQRLEVLERKANINRTD